MVTIYPSFRAKPVPLHCFGVLFSIATRFILKEGRFFEAPTSIPDRQLRYDMGRNYQAGFQVHFDYTFSKTYPSEEMYYRAKEEEHRVVPVTLLPE